MTKEDFLQWKDSQVTKEIFQCIRNFRQMQAEGLIRLGREGNPIQSARASGICDGLDHLLNIQWDDTSGENAFE